MTAMSGLVIETAGHVRILRLDRAQRKNALTGALGWRIVRAVQAADADDEIRVIALTAYGDAFCSGLDVGPHDGEPEDEVDTGLTAQEMVLDEKGWVGRFLQALRFDTDKPVVVGINGIALGAGVSLALAADVRIAADDARFHPGYLRAGTSPDGGLTWTLPLLVGHERAMRFLLEPRFFSAEEALRLGLVSEVVPHDSLDDHLRAFCARVADQAPLALRRTKHLIARAPFVTDLDSRMVDEFRFAIAGFDTEDGQEAIRAMVERRPPRFRGR
jgi:2-(1,2-epoxy-1,2-dihydrophenyl)acetyl-CoA isomerase